jgi:RNA polymerase sigma factor (sigma-70 family)
MISDNYHIDLITWRQLSNGDEEAFRRIVHIISSQWIPYIANLVKSDTDAYDIMQEVWVKVWLQKEELSTLEQPAAWVTSLINYTSYDFMRARARRSNLYNKMPEQEEGDMQEFQSVLNSKDMQNAMEEAVNQLPKRQRIVFKMARLEGYSRKQIAEKLDISENTVRNILAQAMGTIQEYVKSRDALLVPLAVFLIIEAGITRNAVMV